MVSYFSAGTQWAAKTGNPAGVNPDDACGKKVAVQTGTVQVDDITARSKDCADAGKPTITIDQYQAQDRGDRRGRVRQGRRRCWPTRRSTAYAVKQTNGQLELLGDIYDSAPYGYVVKKDQAEFAEALVEARQRADRRRHLRDDPRRSGASRHGAHRRPAGQPVRP